MKITAILLILLVASCAHLPHTPAADALLVTLRIDGTATPLLSDAVRTYSRGEWDIPSKTRRLASAVARDHGLTVTEVWPLETVGELCLVVKGKPGALAALQADSRVASVQRIRQFVAMEAAPYNDDRVLMQLGDRAQALSQLHEWATGAGVRVGIIDSPIDRQHPDLRHRVNREVLMIDRQPLEEDKVHGTAVAGIIGAEANNHVGVVGFAPDAELFSYAACRFIATHEQTRCNSFSLALAIEAAARDHIQVLNLSLAGPDDPLLARMLATVANRGTIIVAAVEGTGKDQGFPAALPFVIAAGPSSTTAGRTGVIRVDDEHLSTTVGGRYRFFYGASMSTARVSALVALMLERNPDLDVAQSRAWLENPSADCEGLLGQACMMRFALESHGAGTGVMD